MAEHTIESTNESRTDPASEPMIIEEKQIAGVILAGGMNRRMGGRMKALLQLDGQLFIERQLVELSKLCAEIIIVANEPELFEPQLSWRHAKVRIVRDVNPGKGPLAGLQVAFAECSYEELWVVACDMPFVSSEAAEVLVDLRRSRMEGGFDAALPMLDGRLQPLHAIYHRRCLRVVNELLDSGQHRVMELLKRVNCAEAKEPLFEERGISLAFTQNVNEPADLEKLIR